MSDGQLKETPSQTAGPYVHIGTLPTAAGLEGHDDKTPWRSGLAGPPIAVEGVIRDGNGELVRDAMVEIWQADAEGRFDAQGQRGFARSMTDFEIGVFRFETVKPGGVALPDGRLQAPHLSFYIFARGINIHLHTRVYFSDEGQANEADPVLNLADVKPRQRTLIAQHEARNGETVYRFDIVLQGEDETVFFDV